MGNEWTEMRVPWHIIFGRATWFEALKMIKHVCLMRFAFCSCKYLIFRPKYVTDNVAVYMQSVRYAKLICSTMYTSIRGNTTQYGMQISVSIYLEVSVAPVYRSVLCLLLF